MSMILWEMLVTRLTYWSNDLHQAMATPPRFLIYRGTQTRLSSTLEGEGKRGSCGIEVEFRVEVPESIQLKVVEPVF